MPILAQTADTGLFDRLLELQAPSQVECVDRLAEARLVLTMPLAVLGVVYLLLGWKFHKPLVAANAVAAGALAGGMLANASGSDNPNIMVFGSIAGAILLGVLAILLLNGAVSLMGVLAGGAIGFSAWTYVSMLANNPTMQGYPWAGGLIGLVALGLLAYANFRLAVMIFTAFQGAVMLVAGATSLLLSHDGTAESIRTSAQSNAHLLAALVGVPAVVGFAVQYVVTAKKLKKKLKGSGG